jgi:hypothetical protein
VCGADAGEISLSDAGELRREAFTGVLTQSVEPYGALRDAIAAGDAAAVHAIDRELAPWWCPDCAASYCGAHWARWDVFDDEGFHDCIRGRCPHGHERLLED